MEGKQPNVHLCLNAGFRIRTDLMRIRVRHFFNFMIRIQSFDDQKIVKILAK